MNQNLRQNYNEKVVPMLMEQFKYKNINEVPKITKITINRGLGDASKNSKALESSIREIATITGQQPVVTKAKKSVAGFIQKYQIWYERTYNSNRSWKFGGSCFVKSGIESDWKPIQTVKIDTEFRGDD